MSLDPRKIREQYPSLGSGAVFFDNPGGTQVPDQVIARMTAYLRSSNANRGGAFETSRETDRIIRRSRAAMADFLGAGSPDEIVFGPNMTSLTLNLARSMAEILQPEDEIIVTRLDHDANIAPWLQAARSSGAQVRWLDFDIETGQLRVDDLAQLLGPRTRLVAVGYASNALGTVNPIEEIIELARDAGAWTYVDAVQYAPHAPIDVQSLDCDFLVVSAYKFFGPHLGALYGKQAHLERLPAFKVRPAPDRPPGKFETGTQNHEGIAGTLGALEYLAGLTSADDPPADMRGALRRSMQAIQEYESGLTARLLAILESIPAVTIFGQPDRRVPTVSCRVASISPRELAAYLGDQDIYVWDGNFYALSVTERLELEDQGGLLRIGLAHYNTLAELDRFETALLGAIEALD